MPKIMAEDNIARGVIDVHLNDAGVIAGLESINAKFKAVMSDFEHQRAEATVDADIRPMRRAVEEAKLELKRLNGEAAEIKLGGGKVDKTLSKQIQDARLEVQRLQGETSKVEFKNLNLKEQIEDTKKYGSLLRKAEADAYRMDSQRTRALYDQTVGVAKQRVEVQKLQREYARVADKVEKLNIKRVPFNREARVKLQLDRRGAEAELEAIKARLEFLGGHPPVGIEVEVDRHDRAKQRIFKLIDDLSNLGRTRVNLGPITTSLRGLIVGGTVLAPILSNIVGGVTALAGVLTTGLAGSAAIGTAGLIGLGQAAGGVIASVRPMLTEFKLATQVQSAYTKAVAKYGANSKQAATAQKQLNSVMSQLDPTTRAAVKGISEVSSSFHKLTDEAARKSFGDVIGEAVKTAQANIGFFGKNTKETLGILDQGFSQFFKNLRSKEQRNELNDIADNFNRGLQPALSGFNALETVILRIAASASRFLGPIGQAFEGWAKGLEDSIKPGQKLDDQISRLAHHAQDVGRFFVSLGKLMLTVLNGGADAGDRLTRSMTGALNRWNEFLHTDKGRRELSDFFDNSVEGLHALYALVGPIAKLFLLWATGLAPAVNMIVKIASFVTKLFDEVGKLIGLKAPLVTLGATIGAIFAVNKIGAFAAVLRGILASIKEIGAGKTLVKLFSGGGLKSFGITGGMAEGGAAAGAEIASAMEAAGAVAAAEIGAAIRGGGAAAGAENAIGGAAGGLRKAEKVGVGAAETAGVAAAGSRASKAARGVSLLRSAAAAVVPAIADMGAVAAGVSTAGLAALAAAATYGVIKLANMKSATEKVRDALKDNAKNTQSLNKVSDAYNTTVSNAGRSQLTYNVAVGQTSALKKRLNQLEAEGKKGTAEYRDTLQRLNDTMAIRDKAAKDRQISERQSAQLSAKASQLASKRGDAEKTLKSALEDQNKWQKIVNKEHGTDEASNKRLQQATDNVTNAKKQLTSATRAEQLAFAAAALHQITYQRGLQGLAPLTEKASLALSKLAQQNYKVAKSVGTKFFDSTDVAKVSAASSAALKSGASQKTVLHIVADSKDAEQALARLRNAKLGTKTISVVEHGGKEAIATLEKIAGRKLTKHELTIAERGGDDALNMLARINARKIAAKEARIAARDAATAIINKIKGLIGKLPDHHSTNILANAAQAISAAQAAARAIRDIPTFHGTTVTVNHNDVYSKTGGHNHPGAASGMVFNPARKNAFFGNIPHLGKAATARGRKVSSPTLLTGEEYRTEFVIATNPAYRKSNVQYLKQAAAALGVQSFFSGGFRPSAKPQKDKKHGDPGYYPPLQIPRAPTPRKEGTYKKFGRRLNLLSNSRAAAYVKNLQAQEEDLGNEISIRQRQVKEPDTFLMPTGQLDANGDPVLTIDQKALAAYKQSVSYVEEAQQALVGVVAQEVKYLPIAQKELQAIRRDSSSNLKQLHNEESRLNRALGKEKGKKKPDKTRVAYLQRRIKQVEKEASREQKIHDDSVQDQSAFDGRAHQAGFDYRNAVLDVNDTRDELNQAPIQATTEYNSANASGAGGGAGDGGGAGGGTTDATTDPFHTSLATNDTDIARTDSMVAEAQAGIADAITGTVPNLKDALNASLSAHQSRLGLFQNALKDADPSNDTEAYQGITSEAGAIAQIQQQLGTAAGQPAADANAFNSARYDLFKTFGSNFAPAMGHAAFNSPQSGANVNIVNNFQQMPDAHTWSQGIAWELKTAL